MNKKVYRFFFLFLEKQETFLNQMAEEGWRLVKTSRLSYEFAPCSPNEYEYKVVFIGEKSNKKNKEYRGFYEDMGYDVFAKNANLNYSIGKVRWRPYGKGGGQVATSPGNYNKEIMIVGKRRDGKPSNIFSNNADMADYYRLLLNVFIGLFLLIAVVIGVELYRHTHSARLLVVGGLALVGLLLPITKYIRMIAHYKKQGHTQE